MNRLQALLRTQQPDATAQRNAHQTGLLHVASPRECNTQQHAQAAHSGLVFEQAPDRSADMAELRSLFELWAVGEQLADEDRSFDLQAMLSDPAGSLAWLREQLGKNAVQRAALHTTEESLLARPGAITAHPQHGIECGQCRHYRMVFEPGPSGRRQFQWSCLKKHRILRAGYGLEDVLIADPDCRDFSDGACTSPVPQNQPACVKHVARGGAPVLP